MTLRLVRSHASAKDNLILTHSDSLSRNEIQSIMMDIAEELAAKTFQELSQGPKIIQNSRVWKDPEGYRYLFPWSNLVLLRFLIRKLTDSLPKKEYRRKIQLDDACRSSIRNIEEGFKRATTKEYLEFLGFSQGSLEEVKGDVRELVEDGFLRSQPGSSLSKLGIDLKELNFCLRKDGLKDGRGKLGDGKEKEDKIFAYQPLTILYPPLKSLKSSDLTYEIFMELINKTDFLLRKLVVSLENKLENEQKYYQVEQIRLSHYAKDRI